MLNRQFSQILSFVVAIVLTGCSQYPSVDFAGARKLDDLARIRLAYTELWADAWRLDAGRDLVFDLGVPPENALLRLNFIEDAESPAPVTARVYLGEQCMEQTVSAGNTNWTDMRVKLPKRPDQPCRVVFDCDSPFAVGVCEFVTPQENPPNVLIFLVDALRLDHLRCHGYDRKTSANADAFMKHSVTFASLTPQTSWTRCSVASLLTGAYPNVHGANDWFDVLRPGLPSIAAALAAQGYETHGVMGNPNCLPKWGFGDDFDFYVDADSTNWRYADDAVLTDHAIQAIRFAAGRPWFMYVHAMGPHSPYEAPGDYAEMFAKEEYEGSSAERARQKAIDMYDGEIAYTDMQFGRILKELDRLGLYEDTLIIFVSDHGEEFWDHGGVDHGKTLYEEMLNIPLMIKMPGRRHAGEKREGLVEMVDLAPTVLDILGLPLEPRFQGQSLLPYITTGRAEPRTGYASLTLGPESMRAARNHNVKYIQNLATGSKSWFDLEKDPLELAPLVHPIPGSEELEARVSRMEAVGQSGLHLMIIRGDRFKETTVTGSVGCEGLGAARLVYRDGETHLEQKDGAVDFSLKLPARFPVPASSTEPALLEKEHARLSMDVPADAKVAINIRADGQPLNPEDVFVGSARSNWALTGDSFRLKQLAANPLDFDPAHLPPRFAVYVWYTPDVQKVTKEELSDEMREALEGLGYLE